MVDPVIGTRTDLQPGRLLVAGLLAVAVFALVVSLVSATEWRLQPDLKFLAAVGGTMLNIVTGCIVFAAVRLRRTDAAVRSGLVDEDLAREHVQDGTGPGEDR